jgi:hypothetical protein
LQKANVILLYRAWQPKEIPDYNSSLRKIDEAPHLLGLHNRSDDKICSLDTALLFGNERQAQAKPVTAQVPALHPEIFGRLFGNERQQTSVRLRLQPVAAHVPALPPETSPTATGLPLAPTGT